MKSKITLSKNEFECLKALALAKSELNFREVMNATEVVLADYDIKPALSRLVHKNLARRIAAEQRHKLSTYTLSECGQFFLENCLIEGEDEVTCIMYGTDDDAIQTTGVSISDFGVELITPDSIEFEADFVDPAPPSLREALAITLNAIYSAGVLLEINNNGVYVITNDNTYRVTCENIESILDAIALLASAR